MTLNDTQHQSSALLMSTLAFVVCFAVWTLLAVIGVQIRSELQLSETEFGLLLASPMLSGALARLPVGILVERIGGRALMPVVMLLVAMPVYFLSKAQSYQQFLLAGFLLGLAGSTFAVGIHYVSAWFGPAHQGLVMGIFGAGTLGAAITNLIAPLIMFAYGWRMVPEVFALGLLVIALLFWLVTSEDPFTEGMSRERQPSLKEQCLPLADMRVWRFGLYYFFCLGGYVALALWLPGYLVSHYELDLQTASFYTLIFTLPGALMRILGGWLADKVGARQVNWTVFWVALVCLFFLSYPPTTMIIHGINTEVSITLVMPLWLFMALILVVGMVLGLGQASVYRIIYDYYPERMGVVGGAVGVFGGIGGFLLPVLFGLAADWVGVRSSCFMLMYGLLALCMVVMYYGIRWEERSQRWQDAVANNFLWLDERTSGWSGQGGSSERQE